MGKRLQRLNGKDMRAAAVPAFSLRRADIQADQEMREQFLFGREFEKLL